MSRIAAFLVALLLPVLTLVCATPGAAQDKPKPIEPVKSVKSFQSGQDRITVWEWAPPAQKGKKYPGVVLLHGIDGLQFVDERLYAKICTIVAAQGYVLHLVHYMDGTNSRDWLPPSSGASTLGAMASPHGTGPLLATPLLVPGRMQNARNQEAMIRTGLVGPVKGPNADKVRGLYKNWMTAAKDGVTNLRKQDNVEGDKIGVVGFSLGGFVAMSTAVADPDLKLAAVVQLFAGLPHDHYANVKAPLPPLFIIHSKADKVVPFAECEALMKVLTDKNIEFKDKIFPRAEHMFLQEDGTVNVLEATTAFGLASAFLEKHLKNGAAAN